MNSFEIYQEYIALKRHFHSKSFDYFKYRGKVKVSVDAFNKRNDKIFFKKLTKYRDPVMMLVYNLAENDKWIGEICLNEESLQIFNRHKKTNQSLTYEFRLELQKFETLEEIISAENNSHPSAIRKYLQGVITLETLVLITDILRPVTYWNRKFPDDVVIEQMIHRVGKFKNFMTYDRLKMKQIMKDVF